MPARSAPARACQSLSACRFWALVWSGWVLSYVALLGTVLVRGPYDAAEGLGQSFNSGLLHATLSSRLGALLEAQAVLFGKTFADSA